MHWTYFDPFAATDLKTLATLVTELRVVVNAVGLTGVCILI